MEVEARSPGAMTALRRGIGLAMGFARRKVENAVAMASPQVRPLPLDPLHGVTRGYAPRLASTRPGNLVRLRGVEEAATPSASD